MQGAAAAVLSGRDGRTIVYPRISKSPCKHQTNEETTAAAELHRPGSFTSQATTAAAASIAIHGSPTSPQSFRWLLFFKLTILITFHHHLNDDYAFDSLNGYLPVEPAADWSVPLEKIYRRGTIEANVARLYSGPGERSRTVRALWSTETADVSHMHRLQIDIN